MKVNILLSTYNGEKFLAEQLDSICQQSFQNWALLIRDDGSTDGTPQIIADYVQRDDRISWINPNHQENLGVIASFHNLVKHEEADYYFFADQDDVWLPNKLELTLSAVKGYDKTKPVLVYTDLKVVDQNLKVLSESMIRSQSHHANTELVQELTENTVTGGTMMINHSLAALWQTTDNLLMHDWYLALLATAFGELIYIDQATQLYRQHGANVLGARTWSKRLKHWLAPQQLLAKYWWLITSSQEQAKHLLALPLGAEQRELVEAFTSLTTVPLKKRLSLLKTYRFSKNRWFHTLVFRSLILTKIGYWSKFREKMEK